MPFLDTSSAPGATCDVPHFIHPSYPIGPIAAISGEGDATILSVREGKFDYVDVTGEHMTGDRKIVSEGVVLAGRWWHPKRSQKFRNQNRAGEKAPASSERSLERV